MCRRDILKSALATFVSCGPTQHLAWADGRPTSAFTVHDRIVFTYFFSWYRWTGLTAEGSEHIVHPQGFDYLSVHPSPQTVSYSRHKDYRRRLKPNLDNQPYLSYENASWFLAEIKKMAACGIDVVAFDFWAFPDDSLPPRSRLAAKTFNSAITQIPFKHAPSVCLSLESKPLGNGKGGGGQITDLRTTEGGEKLFYAIDAFFSEMARDRWATIDGHAIVILYDIVEGLIPHARGINLCKWLFRDKYGVRLAFFGNESWRARCGSGIDYTCKWGAARREDRLVETTDLMEISPGSNFLGESYGAPRSVDRYRLAWESARQQPKNWIAIETWNEWHEGTGVADTVEDADGFRKVTESQTKRFKKRI